MRIVLVGSGVEPIPPVGYGGIERFIADLQSALRTAGHEAVVINQVRHRRMRDEYPFARALPRLLAESGTFDAVHANSPVVGNRLAARKIPYVYTTHSRHWYYRTQLSHQWGYWLERRAVRRAAAPVALTAPLAATMRAAVPNARAAISVIPFGVDATRFRPAPERRSGTVVLGVGVVARVKRWELAAAALKGTGLSFVLAGPVPDPAYGEEIRAAGDRVELLGELSDDALVDRFASSDLLLHPSAVELLSGAVVQGLSSGLPVVGGPAVAGAVDDGVTGWVVPDTDPVAFVAGLRERAVSLARDADQRARMANAARSEAVRRFSWPAVVEGYLAVYRRVATGSTAG
ncbi:MAG TPA: glycosyltransferase family 4 protein [Thermoplasmata archaeon]|nr:glycosyltransferase family 4 protein [Thermoplasmata archaeon]